MDSMTDDELDGRVDLDKSPSRVDRIARGSGTHPMEIDMLLKCHKQFEKVISKMGKSGLMKGGDAQMAKQMARNPNNVMQQLHKAMDPRMLQQMGGAQNVMSMMKEMSKCVNPCVAHNLQARGRGWHAQGRPARHVKAWTRRTREVATFEKAFFLIITR